VTKRELEAEIADLEREIPRQWWWVADLRRRQSDAKRRGGPEQGDLWKELQLQLHVLHRMREELESFRIRLEYGELDPEAELLDEEVV